MNLATSTSFVRSAVASTLFVIGCAFAHASAGPAPFQELPFDRACTTAAAENKIVFIDFFTTWCGPCKKLDETTWRDPKVVELLQTRSVALRIDAEKETVLAKKYRIEAYPTMLVLNSDGTERDRYVGYMTPDRFADAFTNTLAGKTSLQQTRESLKNSDAEDPRARMTLARKLADASQSAEAFAHYAWCYDHGTDAEPAFAPQLYGALPTAIARLGKSLPDAQTFLISRRDSLQTTVMANPKATSVDAISRLAGLQLALKDDAAVLTTLSALPEGRARAAYGRLVFLRLLQKKHYAEAVATAELENEFKSATEKATRAIELMRDSGRPLNPAMLDGIYTATAYQGMMYAAAFAGAGDESRARALADAVIAWRNTPEIREKLVEGLREVGAASLADAYAGKIPKS